MRANRYVSYLAAEIEPDANRNISEFERRMEAAFDRVSAFNDRGSSRVGSAMPRALDPRLRASADQTSTAMRKVATETDHARSSLTRVAVESNVASTSLFRTAQALNVVQGPLGPLAGRLSSLGYIFRDLAGISLAGVLGGAGAFAIGQISASYQQAYDRLRPFYDTQLQTNRAMSQVVAIARETRQSLDPIAQLYGRIGSAAKDAGVKINQSALTETVAKAARLSGGDADTQQAGITQFLQGFGSGTLGGDELKSIRENTFRLAKALADGLGVPIAKLKQLGADGKLTPQVIAEALKRSADQIDIEFSRLALRPGQAITQASTNLSVFLGQLDQATGATVGFAKGIQAIGNNLDVTLSALAGFGATFIARNLSAPIAAASTALAGFRREQQLIGQARRGAPVTLLTPTGVAQAKANTNVEAAAANQRAADATQRAERAALFSIEQRLAAAREILATSTGQMRIEQQGAQQAVVLARARVSAAEQELALAQQTSAARRAGDIESARARVNAARTELQAAQSRQAGAVQRVAAANMAVESAGTGPGSRADRARATSVALRQQAVAEAELASAQAATTAAAARLTAAEEGLGVARAAQRAPTAALAAATAELTVAQEALASATAAATAAATTNTTAVNAQAARGIATLALAEQRIAAEVRVAAATAASTVANEAQTAAMAAQAVAQRAFQAATALSVRALGTLRAAAAGISALLGGPVGIALTAATVGFTYLATRTDDAADAAKRFQDSQAALAEKLGTTTAQLMNQSEAARQLRVNLAAAGLEQARQARQSVRESLAASLETASARLRVRGKFEDADKLSGAAVNLRAGRPSGETYESVQAIRNRNPGVFKFGNGFFGSIARGTTNLLGGNPENLDTNVQALAQTGLELQQKQRDLAEAQKALATPPAKLPPIDLSGGKGKGKLTTEQLKAYAIDAADNGTAVAEARAKYARSIADLDAKLAEVRKSDNPTAFDQQYIAGVRAAKNELTAVERAQRSAAAGARDHKKAIAEQNKELETARSNATKLQAITSRYEIPESGVRGGERDKEALDNLFVRIKDGKSQILDTIQLLNNDTGKLEPFTRADAERVKRNIDEGVRRPIADAIKEQGRELEISRLILEGRTGEADLLRQKYDLINRVGNILPEEERQLRNNAALQKSINDSIAQRNRLIDIQVQGYRDMQEAATALVRAAPDIAGGLVQGAAALTGALVGGKSIGTALKRGAGAAGPGLAAIGNIADQLMSSFRDAAARKLTTTLFGDAEQDARDKMVGALEDGSAYLQTAGERLSAAADKLNGAATSLNSPANIAAETPEMSAARAAIDAAPLVLDASQINRTIGNALSGMTDTLDQATDDIVVVASKAAVQEQRQKKEDPVKTSIEDRFNQIGKDFATKIFGANSPLTRAAAKLGTFMSGAQYAGVGVGVSQLFGAKGSSLGAAIGGGLGKSILGGSGGLLEKGLSSISTKLGSFAGPLGSIAGSVLGSVVGGLFGKKADQSNATLSGSGSSITGSTASLKRSTGGLADGVTGGLDRIAQQLGGSVGGYNVSIGTYDGKYRVSTSGQTGELSFGKKNKQKATLVDFGDDQAGAIQFAILDALKDGAIKGIREGARRLLQQGKDLDSALQNAVDFQNVFRELKQMQDPVGAAVDDLNMQFNRLIDIFNQAGASTEEFADLQKLYDLKRAEAVKEAGNSSLDALTDFITGRTAGNQSPLSRGEVYANAQKNLEGFRTDLAAGKAVDTDKLIEALSNLQDASATKNGSRSPFYSDFADILALAEKAKANIEGTAKTPSNLAPSPFASAATEKAIATTAGSTAQMAQDISSLLKEVRSSSGGGGGAINGSSLGYLPSRVAQY